MKEVQVFENLQYKEVGGQFLFDVESAAKMIGLSFVAKSGNEVVRWERVNKYLGNTYPEVSAGDFITERLVYKIAIKANTQRAEKFQDWLTAEVLPSIRKTGGYQIKAQFNVPQTLPEALRLSADLAEQNAEMKPKAIFADAVTSSKTSILVGDLAKLLKQNGIDMGGRRLFEWLRNKGYLIRRNGADYNSPTQRSMEQGLFEIKESSHINGDGVNVIKKTPKVTGKGQQYFINKFLGSDQTELDMEAM